MKFKDVPFGSLYAGPVRNGLTRPTAVRGDGYRMVNMGEIFAYDHIADQPMERVQLNHRELQVATLAPGDLLFARSSLTPEGVGKCSIVASIPEVTTFESHLIRVRLDKSRADSRFYFYFFRSYYGRAAVRSIAKQVGAAGLPGSKLAGLLVPAPTLLEQARIADTLSAYDDLIDNNRRRTKLLEDSVRLLFDEWFVRLRFPGHPPHTYFNGVPEGWHRLPLEQVLFLQRGFDLPTQDREEGPVPIYGATGINGFHNVAKVSGPGIVTGRAGSLGVVHFVPGDFWPLNTSLWVKEFRRASPRFAVHLLRSMNLERYGQGATMPMLDRKVVHQVEVLLPPADLMARFESIATDVHDQIDVLQRQIQKLAAARDLLLPRLMSGELPV